MASAPAWRDHLTSAMAPEPPSLVEAICKQQGVVDVEVRVATQPNGAPEPPDFVAFIQAAGRLS